MEERLLSKISLYFLDDLGVAKNRTTSISVWLAMRFLHRV